MKLKNLIVLMMMNAYLFAGPFTITPEMEKRIDTLMARMTLQEKIGQLVQYACSGSAEQLRLIREGKIGSLLSVRDGYKEANRLQKIAVEETRLGIPLIFGNDIIHGYRTIFPIPLAEASSWDPVLVEKSARISAKEAAAGGTHWTFAPMVDVARDPRWGRIAEGSGEDPYLGSVMARARVRGFQGESLSDPLTVAACAKHYAAYGAAEAGRDYNTVDISEKTLRDVYLPPFKAAVDAGAVTLMSAFNDLNGIPASANRLLLNDILRMEWGFQGFVVSDWDAVRELMNHGVAATPEEAAVKALTAGVDMDMEGGIYLRNLAELTARGVISQDRIDLSVRRILRIKFLLGLFEQPYTDPVLTDSLMLCRDHLEAAQESALRSIVLLKNDRELLPLTKSIKTMAVIGPLADSKVDPLGCWNFNGRAEETISILEGLAAKLPNAKILFERGCEVLGPSKEGFSKAVDAARQADAVILVVGESANLSGESASRSDINLPGVQEELVRIIHETGKPMAVVLMNGRPLTIPWIAENVSAILETWHLGTRHGSAVADVLFGDAVPGGKLPVTFPRTLGQVPIYHSVKNTGRPPAEGDPTVSRYLDVSVTPLYPFGYGLSYTKFDIRNLRVTPEKTGPQGRLTVTVDVINIGSRTGDEVVQIYIRDMAGSTTRPVKELKGFQRITLKPGESRTVEFTLGPEHLGFYNPNMEYVVEPGAFQVMAGSNSRDVISADFEVI